MTRDHLEIAKQAEFWQHIYFLDRSTGIPTRARSKEEALDLLFTMPADEIFLDELAREMFDLRVKTKRVGS